MLLALTEHVESSLKAEVKAASRGSIIHDGWTKFGVHYFGLFSTYMANRLEIDDGGGGLKCQRKPVISLLSVSPLHALDKELENEDDNDEDQSLDTDNNNDETFLFVIIYCRGS